MPYNPDSYSTTCETLPQWMKQLYAKMGKIAHFWQEGDITQLYAILLGSIILFPQMFWVFRWVFGGLYNSANKPYQFMFKKVSSLPRLTEVLLFFGFIAANSALIGFGFSNTKTILDRSGYLAIINSALLSFGYHMDDLYKSYGFTLAEYNRFHFWVAGIIIIEALTHSIIAIKSMPVQLGTVSQITMWMVCLAPIPP